MINHYTEDLDRRIARMKIKSLDSNMDPAGDLTQKGNIEKREHERFSTSLKGEAVYNSHITQIEVVDMSKDGALLKYNNAESLPEKGEIVKLSLTWPMQEGSKALNVEGIVVRSDEEGFAVLFGHAKDALLH